MISKTGVVLGVACTFLSVSASAMSEEIPEKPRIYADPKGRFSFQLSGDWIKLRTGNENGVAGSFLLTKKIGSERKVVAELLISFAEPKAPVSLEEYVKAEDRRVMNAPGFSRIGRQESLSLAGCPATKNRYALSPPGGTDETRQRIVHQYYVAKGKEFWGITLAVARRDEAVLAELERLVVDRFQFSVPDKLPQASLEVFKKVAGKGARGGFSLTVPEAWEVRHSKDEGLSVRGPDAFVHAFSVARDAGEESPQTVAGAFLKERENLQELRVVSQGAEEVGGVKGYAVEYSGVGEGRQWHVRLVTFLAGERIFFVYCVTPEGRWMTNKGVLERIPQSFSVETPAEQAEGKK